MFKLKPPKLVDIAIAKVYNNSKYPQCGVRLVCVTLGSVLLLSQPGTVMAADLDTGDAPASYGSAVHTVVSAAPYLGVVEPDDGSANPGAEADSDDQINGTLEVDDEDGVSDFPILVQGQKAYTTNVFATNPTGAPATLVGWVDFDGNGVFDADEAASLVVPAGASNEKFKLTWNHLYGITTAYMGDSYARFRISSEPLTAEMAVGTAIDGEVEDYKIIILPDIDGDEITDSLDPDNDNDGIPDAIDGIGVDTDNDGIENYLDIDSDQDGIPDFIEAGPDPLQPVNTDGDNDPDFLDLDSDGDGNPDSDLVTGDLDGDGLTGAEEGLGDADGDGVANTSDIDSDNDTIPDAIEGLIDTDNDGVPNFLDLDSDNDGIPDVRESGYDLSVIQYLDADGDYRVDSATYGSGANGLADIVESTADDGLLFFALADTDGDGVRDYLDTDSDNDGEPDVTEAGGNDVDNNEMVDVMADANSNTIPDSVEFGIATGIDTDGDLIIDAADIDSNGAARDDDEDGIIDSLDPDANGDGVGDGPLNLLGSDGSLPDIDGVNPPDYLDGANAVNNGGTIGGTTGGTTGGPSDGPIETGLQGAAGCSLGTPGAPIDPALALLALLSACWIGFKHRTGKV